MTRPIQVNVREGAEAVTKVLIQLDLRNPILIT